MSLGCAIAAPPTILSLVTINITLPEGSSLEPYPYKCYSFVVAKVTKAQNVA